MTVDWREYAIHDDDNVKGFFGDYRFLSNFHTCPIMYNGMYFMSTEAAYQSAKCAYKDDAEKFTKYSASESKTMSKTIARKKSNWNDIKFNVMAEIVFFKFLHHLELQEMLLNTGDRHLEELNHWNDKYWGVFREDNVGENNLGEILMSTRAYFAKLKNI